MSDTKELFVLCSGGEDHELLGAACLAWGFRALGNRCSGHLHAVDSTGGGKTYLPSLGAGELLATANPEHSSGGNIALLCGILTSAKREQLAALSKAKLAVRADSQIL